MDKNSKSRAIGITMGCPAGIGPEIILKFFAGRESVTGFRPVVLGDIGVLQRAARELGIAAKIVPWLPAGQELAALADCLPVLSLSQLASSSLAWGQPTRETGRAMVGYIEAAAELLRQGRMAAVVTCPISKSSLRASGSVFPGHTEMLASLFKAEEYAMMMAGNRLRVALLTIHTSLASVAGRVTRAELSRHIRLTADSLRRDFGIVEPRLAVAGLNPHAGEAGLFGMEEEREIAPAVAEAKEKGFNVKGPLPPDTVFYRAQKGEFDAVLAMYHDQGLIPFKLLHFVDGVNITIGLPFVRTSVDHGTAYDIAGKGLADHASLGAAYRMAAAIVVNRERFQREHEKS